MGDHSPILTVTLNAAVDVATTVAQVIAGPKLRCAQPRFDPGGGGVNVARTVCRLGGVATALVAVGGAMGDRLLGLLAGENVPTVPVGVSGETRQSFAVIDESTAEQYRFGVPGQPLTALDASNLIGAIADHTPLHGQVVISGSVAPGLPQDFHGQIVAAIADKAPKLILDTSGAALDQLIARPIEGIDVLRVDEGEAVQAAGRPIHTPADCANFAADLIGRGVAKTVISGLGAKGSVMVTADSRYFCRPPVVEERSKIGAGDAFVGGLTLALARGDPPERALQWGVAAASATVSTEATALCDQSTVESRFAECRTEQL